MILPGSPASDPRRRAADWREPITPADPILALPNVIATPHVAGAADSSYADIADVVACNIERLRRGEAPLHRVA